MQIFPLDTSSFPPYEQFPAHVKLVLLPVGEEAARVLVAPRHGPFRVLHAGMQDLTQENDGFRWSLAFHAAFAVHLGWSPVVRDLLGLKRRSSRSFEKAEDGVRAQMIAEAVAALLFVDASEPLMRGNSVPNSVLDEICDLTSPYEVRGVSSGAWIQAAISGFRAWSCLRREKGGILDLDFGAKSLKVLSLPPISITKGAADKEVSPRPVEAASSPRDSASALTKRALPRQLTFLLQETKPNVSEIFWSWKMEDSLMLARKPKIGAILMRDFSGTTSFT